MPQLTLCTIARDEQDLLGACLASVRGVVDRIVVVDTGSTDGTVALAERAGAEVVHHAWRDDFAAARNAALDHVEGGFVLVLDADERLAPGHGAALRALTTRPGLDGAHLALHNASRADASPAEVLDGRARLGEPLLLARLLRRTSDLRWEGLVHEHVTSWARGKRIETAESVSIVHYGVVPELRVRRRKRERNLRLLERVSELEPDNVVYRTHLAHELFEAGEAARARAEAERAWRALEAQQARGSAPSAVSLATLRAFLALKEGELDLAAGTLERARAWSGAHPNFDLLECVHAERALLTGSDLEAATRGARQALRAGGDALAQAGRAFAAQTLPGATSWATATRLGTLHLLLDEPAPALACFERALASKAGHEEALLGRAEALILTGRAAEALNDGAALVASDTPDGWILAAVAALELGRPEDLGLLLARAEATLARREPLAPHRRWYFDELQSQARLSAA